MTESLRQSTDAASQFRIRRVFIGVIVGLIAVVVFVAGGAVSVGLNRSIRYVPAETIEEIRSAFLFGASASDAMTALHQWQYAPDISTSLDHEDSRWIREFYFLERKEGGSGVLTVLTSDGQLVAVNWVESLDSEDHWQVVDREKFEQYFSLMDPVAED